MVCSMQTDRDGRDAAKISCQLRARIHRGSYADTHVVEGAIWSLEERRLWPSDSTEARAQSGAVAWVDYAVLQLRSHELF